MPRFLGVALALAGACSRPAPDAVKTRAGDAAAQAPRPPPPYVPMALAPGGRNERGLWLGSATPAELLALGPRWRAQYDGYAPAPDVTSRLREAFARDRGLHLDVVFGSWCHDSVREVPRFLRLVAALGAAAPPLRYVGVDYRKRDPSGLGLLYGTRNVPTFVVLRTNVEVGRIIERPRASLEADLLAIVLAATTAAPPPPPAK